MIINFNNFPCIVLMSRDFNYIKYKYTDNSEITTGTIYQVIYNNTKTILFKDSYKKLIDLRNTANLTFHRFVHPSGKIGVCTVNAKEDFKIKYWLDDRFISLHREDGPALENIDKPTENEYYLFGKIISNKIMYEKTLKYYKDNQML